MKKFLIIYAVLFVVSGCATVKTPQVSGTSKEDRFVDLSFEYGLLERPKVNWEQAESTTVTQKCLSWGYQKPSASSEVNDECLETNQNGRCVKHAVSKRYQCGLSSQQIAAKNEAIRNEEIRKQNEEKQRRADLARNYPYMAILTCEINNNPIGYIVPCFTGKYDVSTAIEINNGGKYFHLQGYEVNQPQSTNGVGEETQNGFIIPLAKNFSISAQNASDMYKLRLKIEKVSTGEIIFEKAAGQYQQIKISN